MSLTSIVDFVRRSPASSLVLVIVLGAFGLRIWGIEFGLPYLFHNDEGFEVIRALQLGSGEFDFDRVSKGGYFYLLFIEFGFLFVLLKIFGIVSSPNDFAQLFVSDPTLFYLVGRATTALIGSATIFAVYRIGRIAYSDRAGVFAAVILAVNILHANLSHYITVDVPMTFLVTVSLYFAIKLAKHGGVKNYRWAALFAAFAVATKFSAIVIILPLLVAHLIVAGRAGGGIRPMVFGRNIWQAILIFILSYLILVPGFIVNFDVFVASIIGKFVSSSDSTIQDAVAVGSGGLTDRDLFEFYVGKIKEGMGLPAFVLSLAGLGYGIWSRKYADIILISFAFFMFLAISVTSDAHYFFPRYVLPVLPVLAILGGRILSDVFEGAGGIKVAAVKALILIIICSAPAYSIVRNDYLMTQTDTRALAKEWIDENVSIGSVVLIEGSRTKAHNGTVPLRNTAENLRASIDFYRSSEPGKARYFELQLQTLAGSTYDLFFVEFSGPRDLQYYKDSGVQYLVLRPAGRAEIRLKKGWSEFFTSVRNDPDVQLIRKFEPNPVSTPGPLIEVYRVGSNTILE